MVPSLETTLSAGAQLKGRQAEERLPGALRGAGTCTLLEVTKRQSLARSPLTVTAHKTVIAVNSLWLSIVSQWLRAPQTASH